MSIPLMVVLAVFVGIPLVCTILAFILGVVGHVVGAIGLAVNGIQKPR